MKKIENIYLIGLGGIGCAYASKLRDLDPEIINVIADEERTNRYRSKGLIINNKEYNFNYVSPEVIGKQADLIIVSVKYHHLEEAIKNMKNFVGPDTIILSLLNGISSEEIIGKVFGMDKMLYGMCVGIDAVREGNKIRFSSTGKVNFGEKINLTNSSRVEAIKEIFESANISYSIPEDMIKTLWWKFMVNVGINQASAVLKAPYEIFNKVKEARELMETAMKEVIELSQKVGINLTEDDIKDFNDILKNLDPKNKTSMLQDIEAGRKTEVEMFSGQVCEMGEKYGVDTKVNRTLYNIIKSIEER
ncbi:MAG: ketopantoate reductase family protein [Clostridiaceae bacterium]|nr:ketopantoate reductase family protein [Clostridiaceae bacterium]